MPGRHGAMRYKRNKSARQRPDQMETTLKDSIHNSRRREQAILKDLVPPRLQGVKKGFVPTSKPATTTKVAPLLKGKRARAEAAAAALESAAERADAGLKTTMVVDPSSLVAKLASLRNAVAAGTEDSGTARGAASSGVKIVSPAPAADWASRRQEPAPEPRRNERAERIAARRRAAAQASLEGQQRARERRAARAAAAAAEAGSGSDDDGGNDDPTVDPDAPATAASLVAKLPAVGKKEAARTAFKVLKAKVAEKKEQRAAERKAKAAKKAAKAAAPKPAADTSAKGKGKKGAGKKKGGKNGKKKFQRK